MASAGVLQPSGRLNSAIRSTPLGLSAFAHALMAARNTAEEPSRSAAMRGHWLPLPASNHSGYNNKAFFAAVSHSRGDLPMRTLVLFMLTHASCQPLARLSKGSPAQRWAVQEKYKIAKQTRKTTEHVLLGLCQSNQEES